MCANAFVRVTFHSSVECSTGASVKGQSTLSKKDIKVRDVQWTEQKGLLHVQRHACAEEILSLVENCIHTGTWFSIPMCMKLLVKLMFDYKL